MKFPPGGLRGGGGRRSFRINPSPPDRRGSEFPSSALSFVDENAAPSQGLELVDLGKGLARAEGDAFHGIVRREAVDARVPGDELGEASQQRTAAREDDSPVYYIGGEFRRR
ncbi:hypothetical protein SDC9_133667 [bioreactor metagenome]|uniref:Uncharacterized protein n=1 Tax=bioreactor metagenome TaxID=1076179 RepID=A0A645DC42_9ZZZZ